VKHEVSVNLVLLWTPHLLVIGHNIKVIIDLSESARILILFFNITKVLNISIFPYDSIQ